MGGDDANQDVSLGKDPDWRAPVGHQNRADVMLIHDVDRLDHGGERPDRIDGVPFSSNNVPYFRLQHCRTSLFADYIII